MEYTVQTFTLGKSTVVTLPKDLGIQAGTKMKLKKQKGAIILKPAKNNAQDIDKFIRKLSGGMNFTKVFGKSITPGELNRIIDEQYEDVLPRR